MLKGSMTSFEGQDYELLLAVDKDDPQLEDYLAYKPEVCLCDRYGYGNLDIYYNKLAKNAKGDWLVNWNDDSVLHTNIEEILKDLDPAKPCIVIFGGDTCFPVMSMGMYKLLGHYTAGPSIDSYLMAIAKGAGCLIDTTHASIDHQRDNLHDGTANERLKSYHIMDARMDSDETITQRLADIERIKQWYAA